MKTCLRAIIQNIQKVMYIAENPNLPMQNKYVNSDTEGNSSDGSFNDYTTDDSIDEKEDEKSSSSDENNYV